VDDAAVTALTDGAVRAETAAMLAAGAEDPDRMARELRGRTAAELPRARLLDTFSQTDPAAGHRVTGRR
jgi:hypothetical protein